MRDRTEEIEIREAKGGERVVESEFDSVRAIQ